jgi:Rps23 Pro-64 3,4-dihydroxylase Tpa1-like proline 4-hydroxylase
MSESAYNLNPDLDVEALAAAYATTKRGQVPDFLGGDGAERLLDTLTERTPWQLTYFDGERDCYLPLEKLQAMSPQERMAFGQERMQLARAGFAYAYNTFKFHEAFMAGEFPDHPLRAFDAFLNSEELLSFARAYVGDDEISGAGGHATWFGPGHYLNIHTDKIGGVDRRAAFVLNLTKFWKPDWGGELKFFAEGARRIEEAFLPAFNVLNVFTVPKPHSVGYVAPFAGGPRLAITGWFYAGAPPG